MLTERINDDDDDDLKNICTDFSTILVCWCICPPRQSAITYTVIDNKTANIKTAVYVVPTVLTATHQKLQKQKGDNTQHHVDI